MKLNQFQEQMLKHLRKQVDRLQDERYQPDARPSIIAELNLAQQELKDFTTKLRKEGYNI